MLHRFLIVLNIRVDNLKTNINGCGVADFAEIVGFTTELTAMRQCLIHPIIGRSINFA